LTTNETVGASSTINTVLLRCDDNLSTGQAFGRARSIEDALYKTRLVQAAGRWYRTPAWTGTQSVTTNQWRTRSPTPHGHICKIFISVTDEEDKVANLSGGYRVVRT
jgi:hypothetical protein